MKSKKKFNISKIIWSTIGVIILAVVVVRLASPPKLNYTEVKAITGDLATYYNFTGSIEAINRQTVFAEKPMQVNEVKIEKGDKVTTDTVLMTGKAGENIKPKISGEISNIYIEEDSQLLAGSKLIDIVDYSNLQLKIQVDEYDLSALTKDKEAIITIHALKKDVNGKVTEVSKEGQFINGITNFTANISLPNDNDLRVGMSGETKILNQSVANVVIIPMSAIEFDDNYKPYVLKKGSNNMPQKVEITIGINDGVNAEIKNGVTADEIVLVPPTIKSADFGPGSQMREDTNNSPQTNSGGKK